MRRAGALGATVSIGLAILGCSNPSAPFIATGTYHLVACAFSSGQVPLPCAYPIGAAGDSSRAAAGSVTLLADGTCTFALYLAAEHNGVWSADNPTISSGTYHHGADNNAMSISFTGSYAGWRIDGARLDARTIQFGMWIFRS